MASFRTNERKEATAARGYTGNENSLNLGSALVLWITFLSREKINSWKHQTYMEEGHGKRGSDETEEDASEIEELRRLLKERETENARLKKELLIYRKMPAFNRSEMGKDEFLPAAPLIRHEYRIVSPVAVDIGGTLAKVVRIPSELRLCILLLNNPLTTGVHRTSEQDKIT